LFSIPLRLRPRQNKMSEDNTNIVPIKTKPAKERSTAAILAFLLGWCGAHKFYMGYVSSGIVYLLIFILSLFMIFSFFFSLIGVFTIYIPFVFAIVDGILYMTKTDEEFQKLYVEGHREWF